MAYGSVNIPIYITMQIYIWTICDNKAFLLFKANKVMSYILPYGEGDDRKSVRNVCSIKFDPNKTIKTNIIIKSFTSCFLITIPVTEPCAGNLGHAVSGHK